MEWSFTARLLNPFFTHTGDGKPQLPSGGEGGQKASQSNMGI